MGRQLALTCFIKELIENLASITRCRSHVVSRCRLMSVSGKHPHRISYLVKWIVLEESTYTRTDRSSIIMLS